MSKTPRNDHNLPPPGRVYKPAAFNSADDEVTIYFAPAVLPAWKRRWTSDGRVS